MKKLFLLFSVIISVLFSSCNETIKIPEVISAVDNNAVVSINNTEYDCHITYVNATTSSVSFNSPDNLKGMVFAKSTDNNSVSLGSLVCKNPDMSFTNDCIPTKIIKPFENIRQDNIKFLSKKDDLYMFTAKSDPSLKVLTDSHGNIKKIIGNDLQITFK